jgi:hypothetical protein
MIRYYNSTITKLLLPSCRAVYAEMVKGDENYKSALAARYISFNNYFHARYVADVLRESYKGDLAILEDGRAKDLLIEFANDIDWNTLARTVIDEYEDQNG